MGREYADRNSPIIPFCNVSNHSNNRKRKISETINVTVAAISEPIPKATATVTDGE